MIPQYRLITLLLSVLALEAALLGYGHYRENRGVRVTTATFNAAIDKQKAEAATALASETGKVRSAELALQNIKNKQELQDADHQKTVGTLSARLRGLAGPAGRLRDPFAAGRGGGGGSAPGAVASAAADRADDGTETGGLLSEQLTELLRARLREADDINAAYASCRADIYTVRAAR